MLCQAPLEGAHATLLEAEKSTGRAISAGLRAILERCLDPDPARRYHRGLELAEDLDRWRTDRPLVCATRAILGSHRAAVAAAPAHGDPGGGPVACRDPRDDGRRALQVATNAWALWPFTGSAGSGMTRRPEPTGSRKPLFRGCFSPTVPASKPPPAP